MREKQSAWYWKSKYQKVKAELAEANKQTELARKALSDDVDGWERAAERKEQIEDLKAELAEARKQIEQMSYWRNF